MAFRGFGMDSVTEEAALPEVFAGDSENERTFYGFSDNEISDLCDGNSNLGDEDEVQLGLSPKEQKATSKPSSGARTFRLRVVLRSSPSTQQSTDDDDEAEEKEQRKRRLKRTENTNSAKKMRCDKFEKEHEEKAVAQLPPSEECGSDSGEDAASCFLAKREQNIKANKAMLAQLMADLQKMSGGAGFLKKQAGKPKVKERSSVRRAPQRRGAPRPNRSKPHLIRPVEDITEDEIQLIADNMTDKVYNQVTGSTCHQCRQKTVDTKTFCRSQECRGIQGQFCGPCLRNRYGEDVRTALLDPEWKCPPCRGICNCSFCRQREGRCPTGILFPLAQYHGFSDVHSYLSSLRNKLKDNDEEK